MKRRAFSFIKSTRGIVPGKQNLKRHSLQSTPPHCSYLTDSVQKLNFHHHSRRGNQYDISQVPLKKFGSVFLTITSPNFRRRTSLHTNAPRWHLGEHRHHLSRNQLIHQFNSTYTCPRNTAHSVQVLTLHTITWNSCSVKNKRCSRALSRKVI